VVAAGDNLWTISRRHSADLASILRWNEGVDPGRLMAGQRILVPGGLKMQPLPKPSPVAPRTASVRPATTDSTAAPRARDGDHIWPLPIRGDLTRGFSAAHPAIDIAAPTGTRVRAIAGGTIVWSGWKNNGGGYVVEIAHPDGMRSTYNHNSKLTVSRGDEVAQGETIALVGSTGWSTGPHLDLRIRMGGRLVDPLGVY
jgi:murein DD-endopeptidase MepM/ murein hydrolase activator NlpD